MEKLVCPNCQEELEFIDKKYCCPCCEREWNEIILKSRTHFDVSFISDINTVWAQEYKIIEDLLVSKQHHRTAYTIMVLRACRRIIIRRREPKQHGLLLLGF